MTGASRTQHLAPSTQSSKCQRYFLSANNHAEYEHRTQHPVFQMSKILFERKSKAHLAHSTQSSKCQRYFLSANQSSSPANAAFHKAKSLKCYHFIGPNHKVNTVNHGRKGASFGGLQFTRFKASATSQYFALKLHKGF